MHARAACRPKARRMHASKHVARTRHLTPWPGCRTSHWWPRAPSFLKPLPSPQRLVRACICTWTHVQATLNASSPAPASTVVGCFSHSVHWCEWALGPAHTFAFPSHLYRFQTRSALNQIVPFSSAYRLCGAGLDSSSCRPRCLSPTARPYLSLTLQRGESARRC